MIFNFQHENNYTYLKKATAKKNVIQRNITVLFTFCVRLED